MAVTADDLKTKYPEFASGYADARITTFIADALTEINTTQWDRLADRGTLALAAHLLLDAGKDDDETPAGPVKKEKIGEVSAEYVVPAIAGDENALASTKYGREYLRLKRLVFPERML